ncbi:oxidoreductase [Mycena galopus ATCC 62051]|nr:oxidoreductase [Mycena galopus ATCC 62051]
MSGPVVLVTGCSAGGIGYALCERFAAEGCRVYATARRLEAMSGLGAHPLISLQTLDVTVDEDVSRVIDLVVAETGQLDIVVNNAGFMGIGPLIEQSLERVKGIFDANAYGALRVAQAAFPHMAARRSGLIINIGSIVADIAVPWNGLYSASKAAMRSMSDILYMELKPFNIKVLYVALARLREGSLFTDFLPNIIQRLNGSQASNSIPTETFARAVVRSALQKKPPRYLTLGGNSKTFKVLEWLPRGFVLWYMWRLYSRRTT